jgi:hypothetical protein
MDYTPLLAYLSILPPSMLLLLWAGGCVGAVTIGVAIAAKLQPPRPADPFASLPPTPRGAHAAGHVDQVDQAPERVGARHSGVGMTRWQPQHTPRAAARRGRHHTGSRAWSGNLLEQTQACELTVDDLAEAMTSQPMDGAA